MNPPQVYMCSPSWTLLPPPTAFVLLCFILYFRRNFMCVLCSVARSCLTLCSPAACSLQPGFPVLHISWSLLRFISIELVMLANHLILCRPLFLLPSIFSSIRVFSNESVLHIRWPKYWSFSFSISPSNEYSGLISFRIYWLDLLAIQGLSSVFFSTTVWKHQFFMVQPSLWQKWSVWPVISSVELLSRVRLFVILELQQARLSCPLATPRACSNSCPLSRWCHPTISSSVVPFSSCFQSFPASGSFPMSQFFTSGGLEFQLQHQSFQWTPKTDLL